MNLWVALDLYSDYLYQWSNFCIMFIFSDKVSFPLAEDRVKMLAEQVKFYSLFLPIWYPYKSNTPLGCFELGWEGNGRLFNNIILQQINFLTLISKHCLRLIFWCRTGLLGILQYFFMHIYLPYVSWIFCQKICLGNWDTYFLVLFYCIRILKFTRMTENSFGFLLVRSTTEFIFLLRILFEILRMRKMVLWGFKRNEFK